MRGQQNIKNNYVIYYITSVSNNYKVTCTYKTKITIARFILDVIPFLMRFWLKCMLASQFSNYVFVFAL